MCPQEVGTEVRALASSGSDLAPGRDEDVPELEDPKPTQLSWDARPEVLRRPARRELEFLCLACKPRDSFMPDCIFL